MRIKFFSEIVIIVLVYAFYKELIELTIFLSLCFKNLYRFLLSC